MAPLVSVLLSVYNGEDFLQEAILSILNQTYSNLEVLIINDASTDNSVRIIESFGDHRIRTINNPKNIGLTKSLNIGLRAATGKYIARMDADDISLPDRIKKQVQFLEDNKDVGLIGSWFTILGTEEIIKTISHPEKVRIQQLFKNAFGHPTVMLRKALVLEYDLFYNESLSTSQDHELWYRFSKHTNVANIPESLLLYRIHEKQITKLMQEIQRKNSEDIRRFKISDFLNVELKNEYFVALNALLSDEFISPIEFKNLLVVLSMLYNRNIDSGIYHRKLFEVQLNKLLRRALGKVKKSNTLVFNAYLLCPVKSVKDLYYLPSLLKKLG